MERTDPKWIYGRKVRKRRRDLDLTQRQLAEKAGLAINYVGLIERGEKNSSLTVIQALAKALQCEPKDLI